MGYRKNDAIKRKKKNKHKQKKTNITIRKENEREKSLVNTFVDYIYKSVDAIYSREALWWEFVPHCCHCREKASCVEHMEINRCFR